MEYIKIRIQIKDETIRTYIRKVPIIVDFLNSLFNLVIVCKYLQFLGWRILY